MRAAHFIWLTALCLGCLTTDLDDSSSDGSTCPLEAGCSVEGDATTTADGGGVGSDAQGDSGAPDGAPPDGAPDGAPDGPPDGPPTPCASATPRALDFGATLMDQAATRALSIESCGGAPLTILDAYLKEGSSAAFAFDPALLSALPLELPAYDSSLEMLPSHIVEVSFSPTEEAERSATLVLITDDPVLSDDGTPGALEIPITGRGASSACPVACVVESEINAEPLDVITLDGGCSTSAAGELVGYRWSVVARPPGSTAQPVERFFDAAHPADGGLPDDESNAQALFFVDLAGEYVIELRVEDRLGVGAPSEACAQPDAVIHINAYPNTDVHIQLVWDTQGDADQTDDEGTDVDLHLLHPSGNNWHVGPLDCFYANADPDWGVAGEDNNCTLDIDDVNGAGPENINIRAPEDTSALGNPYKIGVHYYKASPMIGQDQLESLATVRVYLNGVFAEEWTHMLTHRDDFWEVAGIIWTPDEQRAEEINRFTPGAPE